MAMQPAKNDTPNTIKCDQCAMKNATAFSNGMLIALELTVTTFSIVALMDESVWFDNCIHLGNVVAVGMIISFFCLFVFNTVYH